MEPEAQAYIESDERRRREYDRDIDRILADPHNVARWRKINRLPTSKWKAPDGIYYRYRMNEGCRIFYFAEHENSCLHIIYAGPHDDATGLAFR